jgi:carbamoyl-phosphate synthase large subunit
MKNVLVFPSDSEISREIYASLKDNKNFKLIGATSMVETNKGDYLYETNLFLPYINHEQFLPFLNKLIKDHKIDYIIPAHDDVCLGLATLKIHIDTTIIGQSAYTNGVCRDKLITYQEFYQLIKCPEVYPTIEDVEDFPCFIKPRRGQGSKEAMKIHSLEEYYAYLDMGEKNSIDYILMENLPGDEYTIDCFSKGGKVMFCGARVRKSSKAGISDSGVSVDSEEFKIIAEVISEKFYMHGFWFFQMKRDKNGELVLLEIAPRVSGGMAFYRMRGFNFVELALWMIEDKDGDIRGFNLLPDVEFVKFFEPKFRFKEELYYENVYVDFDDTLYLNKDHINTQLMMFLIQCKNENKNIYILTRTDIDRVYPVLSKWGLTTFFNDVYQSARQTSKGMYMREDSILIDDSFFERESSRSEEKNITCFGINNYQILIK